MITLMSQEQKLETLSILHVDLLFQCVVPVDASHGASLEPHWSPMGPHGGPWSLIGASRGPMEAHGAPWGPMSPVGPLWDPMGPHGTPVGHMTYSFS